MKSIVLYSSVAISIFLLGCGPQAAPMPTEAEKKAAQAPVDDMMKKMQSMQAPPK
jgi:hypothetical protein